MKLIDAEELCNELATVCDDRYDRSVEWCIGILRQAPTVPYINCQNCKYRSEFNIGDKYSCQLGGYVTLTDFCSRGVVSDE